jgi:hypothetical protein
MAGKWEHHHGAVAVKFFSGLLKLNLFRRDLSSETSFACGYSRLREALVQCIHGLGVLLG